MRNGTDIIINVDTVNKDFAFGCMKLLRDNQIDIEQIMYLTDYEFCKEKFNCIKPILKQVNSLDIIIQDEIYDNTSKPRFYNVVFDYNGTYFLITNYWYGPNTNMPDNKTPFYNWVISLIN